MEKQEAMVWLKSIDGVWLMLIAAAIGVIATLAVGKILIPMLQRLKCGQTERDDGPQSHLSKSGTPTMGGLMMLAGVLLACVATVAGDPEFVITAVLVMFGYGLIGFIDDYIKVVKKRSLGLNAKQKIVAQVGLALVLAIYAYRSPMIGSTLYVPILKDYVDFGWFYIPFVVFAVLATTNSVNLTDGLDGLASGVTAVVMAAVALILNALAITMAAQGESVQGIENVRNLMVFSSAVAGACLGFLHYNRYPAKVFMGDTGSMALGAAFVTATVLSRTLLIIPVLGLMFMVSSVSDIIQVASYKLRNKKRVFLMAPLHHHFEKKGYSEVSITRAYILITIGMAAVTLLIV